MPLNLHEDAASEVHLTSGTVACSQGEVLSRSHYVDPPLMLSFHRLALSIVVGIREKKVSRRSTHPPQYSVLFLIHHHQCLATEEVAGFTLTDDKFSYGPFLRTDYVVELNSYLQGLPERSTANWNWGQEGPNNAPVHIAYLISE